MKIVELLKKVKKTKFYYFFLKFFFIPFFTFFWEYILNFQEKIIGIMFDLKTLKKKYINFNNNSKKIVSENSQFDEISKTINQNLTQELIEQKISFIKSEDYKKTVMSNNQAMAINPFVNNLFDDLNENVKQKIVDFATSDFMIKSAYKYLKVYPLLARIYVNLNIPTNDEPRSSQLWHRDDFGYKNLDLFLAINEINDDNGPLYVLKKKDPLNIFYRVKKEIGSNLTGERGKILDKDFEYLNSNKGEIIKLEGKPGTGLFIDSIRNYHKGGYCKLKYRLTLRINYMTSDSTFPIEKLEAQRKSWYETLDDSKKNNFYIKQLFKKRSFLMKKINIPKYLFKFYHAVSIKN